MKLTPTGAGLLLAVAALPFSALAAPTNDAAPPSLLKARIQLEDLPGSDPVRRLWLETAKNRFSFIAPPGFFVRVDSTNKTMLLWKKDQCDLKIQFVEFPSAAKRPADDKPKFAEWLDRCFPNSKVIDEFTCSAGGYSGPGAEVVYREEVGKPPRLARSAWVHFPGGRMELEFLTTPDTDHDCFPFFNQFLLSFARAATDQPLVVNPISSNL